MLDRIPLIKRYRDRQRTAVVRKYLAELGRAVFTAALWLGAVLAAAELFFPGFAVNYLTPGACIAVLAVSGGLALLDTEGAKRTRSALVIYAATGAAASACAFLAVWYYFSPVPDIQTPLSLAAGLIVGAMFVLFDRTDL